MSVSIIERFGEPSKMDTAPYGTICKVRGDNITLYIQTSKNEEDPHWHLVTTFHASAQDEHIQLEIKNIESNLFKDIMHPNG